MDRNGCNCQNWVIYVYVALRKESVDRNIIGCPMLINSVVALRKESVDRNSIKSANSKACITSLSARRAWIEISMLCNAVKPWVVALRKESVDRNIGAS